VKAKISGSRIGLRKVGGQHFDADAMRHAQSCA
jgi:hypothetical protein